MASETSVADEKAPAGLSRYEADAEDGQEGGGDGKSRLSGLLWHGGSAYDAWFSCASNQVAQVLLTLPYSFAQLGMVSGILFQLFYGLLGSWTAYLISILYLEYRTRKEKDKVDFRNHVIQWFEVLDGLLGRHWRNVGLAFNCTFLLFGSVIQLIGCASNIYYVNDHLDKRTWTYIFGACCATTVFIPSFHNYRVWSFLGLLMTTYTAWYIAVASLMHGQADAVKHSGPTTIMLYFTGATNILYTFGGHAVTVEVMHAMWRPQKFKAIYLLATLYVLTLTLPSASAAYWAFGDELLTHSNALSLLPRDAWRDAAVILMLIHQFITFGFACTPLYFVWEKLIGLHDCRSLCKRAAARLPVVIPIWFLAIIFPFFGPINSAVGSLLVSFTVYIIPAMAHMVTFRSPQSREERGGAAAAVRRRLDGGVRDQLVRGGVGARRRLRLRRVGQHHQLRAAGVHLRPLRQVLPVPAPPGPRVAVAHGPEPVHAVRLQHDRHVRPDVRPVSGSGPGPDASRVASPPPPAPPPRSVIARRDDAHDG
ncbi:unnamed protein product [Triticum turgidum subsp. durum]|uniref:Amino acid transporter transmembrane domain-containing protein n=1 Tax=Triticum turgidum subsp. durum TaxID=4567 RepID=A0A9R0PXZ8_TRITD|nr:unnamed protein product [Triticum turgidum subsp. durum]